MSIAKGKLSTYYRAAPFRPLALPVGDKTIRIIPGDATSFPPEGTRIFVDGKPVVAAYREWITRRKDETRVETEKREASRGDGVPLDLLGYRDVRVLGHAVALDFPDPMVGFWHLSSVLIQLKPESFLDEGEAEHVSVRADMHSPDAAIVLRRRAEAARRNNEEVARSSLQPKRIFEDMPGFDGEETRASYLARIEGFDAKPSPRVCVELRGRHVEVVAGCEVRVDGVRVPITCVWQSRSVGNTTDRTLTLARVSDAPRIPFELAECTSFSATDDPRGGVKIFLRRGSGSLSGGYEPVWTSRSLELDLGPDLTHVRAVFEEYSDSSQ